MLFFRVAGKYMFVALVKESLTTQVSVEGVETGGKEGKVMAVWGTEEELVRKEFRELGENS